MTMKVGLTYDLRDDYLAAGYTREETAEFDKVETIEGIENALRGLGYETDRIGHVRHLMPRLLAGDRWDMVFNIAEGLEGPGREAQVPMLLELYGIPYTFSDSLVLALTLHKGMTKRVVRDAGIDTAAFAEVRTLADVAAIDLPYPLFAKPVAEGTGKGISLTSKIENREQLEAECARLLQKFRQPVLVETYLPGREYTVGIVGTGDQARVVAVMEIHYRPTVTGIYSYDTKSNYEDRVDYTLASGREAEACADVALRAWRVLGCRDAGRIDVRDDAAGRPNFIEVNPLAGLNPVHSDLPILCRLAGIEFRDLIAAVMTSALERKGSGGRHTAWSRG
jgi:D-alanine-D-alanine ligase